ncbi:hypothetical protein O3Q52_17310 [Streptomyces sp. ActVer]|uniref:hypothetical protein n=1 Tax=Streptomyces sp. ActVer TaxID=3014558 RepID=UPI0022B320D1|nr:hypothetical protein [Streptomyces sp. ActVer]MCZ4509923.1 hypothetical protein [Streptomyces sp. ActVer]
MNAETFNSRYPVGTPVVAYPACRPEDHPGDRRLITRTRSKAQVLGGHTDVVWVDGHSACIALSHVDVVSEDEFKAARAAGTAAAVAERGALPVPVGGTPERLGHATPAETVPALLATIKELWGLQSPLIDALNTVHQSMTSCVGDEWAEEWLGEVWTQLPLQVRAAAGDKDAVDELAASRGAAP